MKRIFVGLFISIITISAFAQRNFELPELKVNRKKSDFIHLVAYVRDVSSLTSYTDTVLLLREKLVDFMIPTKSNSRWKGWKAPRILKTESYYQFTDAFGKDSVSDRFNLHFSWSDWIGIKQQIPVPVELKSGSKKKFTITGKYAPALDWQVRNNSLSLKIDLLVDSINRSYIYDPASFFRRNADIQDFKVSYDYTYYGEETLIPLNLNKVQYEITSHGRGHNMFKFSPRDEPCYISTNVEMWILDREMLSKRDARKWEKGKFNDFSIDELVLPGMIPELPENLIALKERVLQIDHDKVRLDTETDKFIKVKEYKYMTKKQKFINKLKSLISFG